MADAAAKGARPTRSGRDEAELEALLHSLRPEETERLFHLSLETFLNGIEGTLLRNEAMPAA